MLFLFESIDNLQVERYANWSSLYQMQFGKTPFQIYFHVHLGPGGFFWVVLPGIQSKDTLAKFAK